MEEGTTKFILIGVIILLIVVTLFSSFTVVGTGYVGVKTRFGKVQNDVIHEGLNLKIPYIERIVKIDCRTKKIEISSEGSTKDMQTVTTTVAVNYNVHKETANRLYKDIGKEYEDIIINPAVLESIKSAMAQYTAEELITKRAEVSNKIQETLEAKISERGLIVTEFNLTNIDFSEDYDEIGIVSWEEKAESWCKFSELDNHWSKAEVTLAEKTGIVKGISDTEFAPDNDVTKEQAIWLSMRAAGLSYNESDWQNDAFKYGIIDRFGEYGAYATREQFTDYVIKAYKAAKGGNNMADTSGVFADEQNIESKYLANVLFAYDLGIVEGDENKNFNPKQTLTRAEAAAIVYRMSEKE